MPDERTRRQKLEAMATHPRSNPNEAAVARRKLRESTHPKRDTPPRHARGILDGVFTVEGTFDIGEVLGYDRAWVPPAYYRPPAPPDRTQASRTAHAFVPTFVFIGGRQQRTDACENCGLGLWVGPHITTD